MAEAGNDEAGAGAQDLPVSPEEPSDRPAEPGMGGGHHLRADRAWVPLPRGGDRLGEPGSAGVAALQYHGRVVLRVGARGSAGWPASASRTSSTRISAASLPVPSSPAYSPRPASASR